MDSIVKVIKLLYDLPEISANYFAIYHPYYKKQQEIIESAHKSFFLIPPLRLTEFTHNYSILWSSQKLLSVLDTLVCRIIEVMNLLHDMLNTNKHWFTIYYLRYKDE